MNELRWLKAADGPDKLPDPQEALRQPNGLLAAGGSLSPEWLLASYRKGIFPWFEAGQPILWWSPDPRTVLEPEALVISRSLRKRLRSGEFTVTADESFAEVIAACAEPRAYTDATWITSSMTEAFVALHGLGWAHSFESWSGGELVGGLYGVAIGKVFFGESMFARRSDASKVAFCHAVDFLRDSGYELIDCQLPSAHLTRFGATSIPRHTFLERLRMLTEDVGEPGRWTLATASRTGQTRA